MPLCPLSKNLRTDSDALENPAELDLTTDYKDTLHLNSKGGVKFSKWFAHYLKEKYNLPEVDAALAAQWDADTATAL